MNRSNLLLVSVASVCLVGRVAEAQTCDTVPVPTPHVVDPSLQAIDQVPPTLQSVSSPSFHGVPDNGCLAERSSKCDEITLVELAVNATDDMTPPDKIGYRLSLESGTLPPSLVLPADAIEPTAAGVLRIVWINPRKEYMGDFTLRVVAIDAAGNESAPQKSVVQHDLGCEAVAPPSAGPAALALLLAAWRRRRRKPARCP